MEGTVEGDVVAIADGILLGDGDGSVLLAVVVGAGVVTTSSSLMLFQKSSSLDPR
jgi:hypothetical protein